MTDAATLSARAAQAIEADILAGRLAAAQRIGIVETSARYGVGATPLREALRLAMQRGDAAWEDGIVAALHRLKRGVAAQSQLYDEAYRYRRLMMSSFQSPNDVLESHERLADLVVARAGAAAAELESHVASTLALVYPEARR